MRLLHIFAGSAAVALLALSAPMADAGPRINWDRFPFIFDDGADDDDYYYEDPAPRPRKRFKRRIQRQRQLEAERYFRNDEPEPERYGIFEMDNPEFDDDAEPPRRRLDKVIKRPRKLVKKPDEPPQAIVKKKRAAAAQPKAAAKVALARAVVKPKPKPEMPVITASTSVTCDDATRIVGDYGFATVKPMNCKGDEYAFSAERAGKTYAIKVSSADGELTEVAKQ